MHADQVLRGQRREQIDVALDQCVLGDQRERMPGLQHDLDQLAGQLELAFDRLVRIGVDAQCNRLRHVTRFRQFLAQQMRRIGLGEQLGLEVQPRRQVQIGVRGAREAVGTPTLYVFEGKCSAQPLSNWCSVKANAAQDRNSPLAHGNEGEVSVPTNAARTQGHCIGPVERPTAREWPG